MSILTLLDGGYAMAIGVAPLILAGLGAATNVVSGAIAGKNSKDANAQADKALKDQQEANQAWYQQKMNENYMDSAEAQAAMTKAREAAMQQMASARGTKAVMGGTDASIAAAQQSANKMISDTASGLAVGSLARKDAAEQTYLNRSNELANSIIQSYKERAANSAAAGSQAWQGIGNIASSLMAAYS